ncbi:DUF6074 family protein [Chelativorans salis]|uniref:DUF6074 family protein n=1 Tax=Chelativorans salis TaxID=2978478 RepID=A0ABT2LKF4_9HYPH|nr:DUF6074 family protein [Chelativorans sp. EGI FJ00035]MCT7375081.1 DUF6074 family protein [Chelativorans sp. EGI FJ00035]
MSVLVFPLYRQRDLVNKVVEGLSKRHHNEANLYWRGMAKQLLAHLTASGVAVEPAQEQIRMLFYTALDEMQTASLHASENTRQ